MRTSSKKRTIKQYKEDKKNAVERMKSFYLKPSANGFKQICDLLSSAHIDSMKWWIAACYKKYAYAQFCKIEEFDAIAGRSDAEIIDTIIKMSDEKEKSRDMSRAKASEIFCQIYSATGDKTYLTQSIKSFAEIFDKNIGDAVEKMIDDLGKSSTEAAEVVKNKNSIIADFYKTDIDKKNAELLKSFDELFPTYEVADIPQCDLFTFAESLQ